MVKRQAIQMLDTQVLGTIEDDGEGDVVVRGIPQEMIDRAPSLFFVGEIQYEYWPESRNLYRRVDGEPVVIARGVATWSEACRLAKDNCYGD